MKKYLGFVLDDKEYAIDLQVVKQVSQIVEISPLPEKSKAMLGIINVQGEFTPVINLRFKLGLKVKKPNINDQMLIVHTGRRLVAFIVDQVTGIIPAHQENSTSIEELLPEAEILEIIIKKEERFIMGLKPQKLLDFSDVQKLDKILNKEYEKLQQQIH